MPPRAFKTVTCNKLKLFNNCDIQMLAAWKPADFWVMRLARDHNSAIQGNSNRISQAFNPEKDNKLTCIFT